MTPSRETSAAACIEALDCAFFKALSEPARVDILKVLVMLGRADVGSIAEQVPQDRSVVTRHLQLLERAHILRSQSEGRHTFYEIDGVGVLEQIQGLTALLKTLQPLCCPR